MTPILLYLFAGGGLFLIGLYGFALRPHLLRKLLALNIMGAGIFMILLALAARSQPSDPVPQALVLTGIVIAISTTALGLALLRRLARERGEEALEQGAER
jgi:multicomponent Na+:H+ antiporter subunit C